MLFDISQVSADIQVYRYYNFSFNYMLKLTCGYFIDYKL